MSRLMVVWQSIRYLAGILAPLRAPLRNGICTTIGSINLLRMENNFTSSKHCLDGGVGLIDGDRPAGTLEVNWLFFFCYFRNVCVIPGSVFKKDRLLVNMPVVESQQRIRSHRKEQKNQQLRSDSPTLRGQRWRLGRKADLSDKTQPFAPFLSRPSATRQLGRHRTTPPGSASSERPRPSTSASLISPSSHPLPHPPPLQVSIVPIFRLYRVFFIDPARFQPLLYLLIFSLARPLPTLSLALSRQH
ncbi:hypothetical protein BJX76DRAFT_304905 [Aspergillus varians]